MSERDEVCTDCPKPVSRRDFMRNAAKFGLVPAAALFLGVGGKDILRNAWIKDNNLVAMNDEQLQEWIKTPGLAESHPALGSPEQQERTRQAIRDGKWQEFRGLIFVEQAKPGQAEATCGYYYVWSPISCCQSAKYKCYRCNGETYKCEFLGSSGGFNNCAWCGSPYSNCCG